jgi:hypothetical protein
MKWAGKTLALKHEARGNATAQALLGATEEQRRIIACAHTDELPSDLISAMRRGDAVLDAALKRRESRVSEFFDRVDKLASRKPGNVLERALRCAMRDALAKANFRQTVHGAMVLIRIVERGEERAESKVDHVRPSSLGLPNAYARKGYRVAVSTHTWYVSPALWDLPKRERAGKGWLRLSHLVEICQGRGTELVTRSPLDAFLPLEGIHQ